MQSTPSPHLNSEPHPQEDVLQDSFPEFLELTLREQIARKQNTQEGPLSPEDAVYRTETASLVQRALSTLTPKERLVVEMYFGLDNHDESIKSEIAKITGINRTSVSTLLKNALKKLKKELADLRYS